MTGAGRHNLRPSLSRFIGRERELADVAALLRTSRHLTLTGVAGIGKTRLGLEVAAGLLDAFRDGVWLVELASLSDAALVPRAVATALQVHEEAGRSLAETLAEALRDEQLLLVLDNCEHLTEACADLTTLLLRACPGISILATSRHLLGMPGETAYRVPPLSDAVRLFVERAQSVAPTFALTECNRVAVQRICRRLDGLPLAIELAAARVVVVSPEQIEARLGDRFALLTGGSRGALPRHRTLLALLDWSHDLLDARERMLLRRLAVFADGWTLEAAESVCADAEIRTADILNLLSSLVTKSLVLVCGDGPERRYHVLESIREYATAKLCDAGEVLLLRGRHRDWFLALAERAAPALRGASSVPWLDRLEAERENLWAALVWSIERGDVEPGLRLGGALGRFWQVRGPYRETSAALATLLGLSADHEPTPSLLAARATVLSAAGSLAMRQDHQDAANAYFAEALTITRALGDRPALAVTQFQIGHLARVRGEHAVARFHHWAAIRLFSVLGDDHWTAYAYHDLGLAAYYEGDLATARGHYETALGIAERAGDVPGIASALNDLGEVALLRGDLDEALHLERTCLEMARTIGDHKLTSMTLGALAGLAAAQDRPAVAVRLAAAVTAFNDATGLRHSPAWHALLARWIAPTRVALGAARCAEEEAAGRAMSLEQAVQLALADDPPIPDATASSEPSAPRPTAPRADTTPVGGPPASTLTGREREVAALVARGMTNPQIAAQLVITTGTASNHVKHILARLGFESRVQIAAWAVEQGLHGRIRE